MVEFYRMMSWQKIESNFSGVRILLDWSVLTGDFVIGEFCVGSPAANNKECTEGAAPHERDKA